MVSCRERPKFLNQLCKMCDAQRILPESMLIPRLDHVSDTAFYDGNSAAVYEGKYKGRPVAVKVARIYARDDRGPGLSVSTPFHALHQQPALTPSLVGVL